ncbi:MAG: YIP1 family protein [Gammaproteobacteria bacterium]|nr:YIP1 family protein [Gammaproteobacteria bacterium]MYD81611.1 YIP1 family protein [Gammaproteobacteria bacterium]
MERLWKILISPRQEFDEMREDVSVVLPLVTILLVAGICAAITVYMTPDETFTAVVEAQIEAMENSGQSEAAETQRQLMDSPGAISMMRMMGAIGALIGGPLLIAIGFLILGTFYFVVGKIVQSGASWVDWFGFSCWVSVPIAVGAVLTLVLVAIGGMEWANGLAVLGWFGMTAPWAMAITIPALWTLYITINGLDSWLQKGVVTSVIVALIPLVIAILFSSIGGSVNESFQGMMGG